jgi:hypothetical protein
VKDGRAGAMQDGRPGDVSEPDRRDVADHDAATHDAASHDAASHDAASHDAASHDAASHDAAATALTPGTRGPSACSSAGPRAP